MPSTDQNAIESGLVHAGESKKLTSHTGPSSSSSQEVMNEFRGMPDGDDGQLIGIGAMDDGECCRFV